MVWYWRLTVQEPFLAQTKQRTSTITRTRFLICARVSLSGWSHGGIGDASICTLVKDLRKRFTNPDKEYQEWHMDEESYSVGAVA